MDISLTFRWLGVAGIELNLNGQTLLIDPLVTRFPFWKMGLGCVRSDYERVAKLIPQADFILVTHTHWDHVMDVPAVIRHTGANALGSRNTCRLLDATGILDAQFTMIGAGDRLTLGDFAVEAMPAEHLTILGCPIFSGALPDDLHPPLRARDYRMDRYYSFLIQAAGLRLLDWCSRHPGPAPRADVLFLQLYHKPSYYEALLQAVRPELIIPIHWDDFFHPLDKPVRPTPIWSLLKRVNVTRFERLVERTTPPTQILVPKRFHIYDLDSLSYSE